MITGQICIRIARSSSVIRSVAVRRSTTARRANSLLLRARKPGGGGFDFGERAHSRRPSCDSAAIQ
jgi:hypothetical protein